MPTIPLAWAVFGLALVTLTGTMSWMSNGPARTLAFFLAVIGGTIKGLILLIYYLVPRVSPVEPHDSWWMSLIGIALFLGMVICLSTDFIQGGKHR